MRKMYKKKKRSCALCKPQKRGGAHRWTAKEKAAIKLFARVAAEKTDDEHAPVDSEGAR